jgi:choline dehydrogenase-like flavoprotein
MQRVWDAVIVGAGPTGVLVAEELLKLSVSVLLLDGGPMGRPGYMPPINEDIWRYQLVGARRCYWQRVRAIGGRTLLWGGWANRFPAAVFRDGAWPYGPRALTPYYVQAERRLNVTTGVLDERYRRMGTALGLRVLPKRGSTLEGRPWTAVDSEAAQRAKARLIALRVDHNGCEAATLVALTPYGKVQYLRAKLFVLAASPIETARLLLASGLSSLSPGIGRSLVDHPSVTYLLVESRPAPAMYGRGPFPGAAFVPRFVNLNSPDERPYRGGFCIEIYGPKPVEALEPDQRRVLDLPPGAARELSVTTISSFGESAPHPDRYVDLAPRAKDALGRPIPRIHLARSDAERRMVKDMKAACIAVADALARNSDYLVQYSDSSVSWKLFHEAGTCAMGHHDIAPCDPWGRLRALSNVWVADASVMPSPGDRHPTLTLLAHAYRVARAAGEFLVRQGCVRPTRETIAARG